MFVVLFLCVLPIIFFLLYIKSFSSSFQVLKRNGIDGPAPSFFYGNYKQRLAMGTVKYLHHIHRKYGKIVGIYMGQERQISVTDTELMKLILVKDFDYFMDKPVPAGTTKTRIHPESLLAARGETWRSMRRILSPTFSSFKMKAMTPLIMRSVKNLADVFRKHADTNESFDMRKVFGTFTMESIFAAGFGRVIEIQKGDFDPLTEAGAEIFVGADEYQKTSHIYWKMIFSNFPWLVPILATISQWGAREKAIKLFYDTVERIIQERRQGKDSEKHKDLLQLMIDAAAEERESQVFMLAGYETTAVALSFTSYLLALSPHVQEKLQEEIDTYLEENPEASHYETAQDLSYLDMVMQESLRLYPPSPLFVRHTVKDYSYKGICIPKDTTITFPSAVLHMDPQFWTDPEKFNPLRFTAEEKAKRPQLCYVPFGYGPRNCIGMRFAMLEAKLVLVELLRKFSFVRAPDTQVPLETVYGFSMMPRDGIYLKVKTRDGKETPPTQNKCIYANHF